MATGYFNRVFDTVVSGNSLLSTLTADDIMALEFKAAVSNPIPFALSADTQINADQLIQAALPGGLAVTASGAFSILLGSDAASQAAAYISLFNLRSTNDVRVLKFVNAGTIAAGAALGANVDLESPGTSNVTIQLAAAAAAKTAVMFTTGKASGNLGFERVVLVSATTLTSGSEVVLFRVTATGNAAL